MQIRDVPLWTTPQWRTSDVAFLHLLLYCSWTEIDSTIISDQVCNCPCRHTSILPFLPRIHNCPTFEGNVVFYLFFKSAIRQICIAVAVEQMISAFFVGADVTLLSADIVMEEIGSLFDLLVVILLCRRCDKVIFLCLVQFCLILLLPESKNGQFHCVTNCEVWVIELILYGLLEARICLHIVPWRVDNVCDQ